MKSKNRSVLGIIAAVLLAMVGGLLLWQNSEDNPDSEAVEEPVVEEQVLVARRDIPAGESASTISENAFAYVDLASVPADSVEPGALTSTDNLEDLALARNVIITDIVQGSQITTNSFVVPGQQELSALPDVDPDLFEMTIAFEPERVLAGNLRPGMIVALIGSFDNGPIVAGLIQSTVTVAESVLVTNVQTEQLFSAAQLDNDPLAPSLAATSRLFVTFGVDIVDAERMAYTREFGKLWLLRQHEDAVIDGSELRIIENVPVPLDEDAPSNELRIDPFDPDRTLALVDGNDGAG
jgi:pilus assembly protein CpaB